jgi:hypothetical protein
MLDAVRRHNAEHGKASFGFGMGASRDARSVP